MKLFYKRDTFLLFRDLYVVLFISNKYASESF